MYVVESFFSRNEKPPIPLLSFKLAGSKKASKLTFSPSCGMIQITFMGRFLLDLEIESALNEYE